MKSTLSQNRICDPSDGAHTEAAHLQLVSLIKAANLQLVSLIEAVNLQLNSSSGHLASVAFAVLLCTSDNIART